MSNFTIQHGVWVNHNSPPALGATLTVSIRWGNYLIAALSSLVAFAGTRAWSILSFYLHQRLAAKQEKDLLHQQLQVHFRGGGSVFDSIADGVSLYRAWAGRVSRVKRRTLSLVFLGTFFLSAFAAAGVFVAEVATKSYQDVLVLAAPNDCGDFVLQDGPDYHDAYLDALVRYQDDAAVRARSYARDAYNGTRPGFDAFTRATLPMTGRAIPCPYTNGTTCLGANDTRAMAWMMETGPLDSHVYFGMNAPKHDRIIFSKNVTCAVADPANLTTAPYSRLEGAHKINVTYLGILQEFAPDLGEDSNLAFEIDMNLVYERVGFFTQRAVYQSGFGDPDVADSAPPFLRNDADVVLMAITQGQMFYDQPVDDPVFLAQDPVTGDEYAAATAGTVYYSSKPFSVMACTEQIHFCNPNNGMCTEYTGFVGQKDQILNNTMELNKAQLVTAIRMFWVMNYVGSFSLGVAHGTTGLLVGELNGVRDAAALPANQWTKEADLWFASNLAAIQNGLLQWIAKPWPKGHPEALYPFVNMSRLDANYADRDLEEQKRSLCQNQLIRSTAAVQNFSVLALSIVVAISLSIIITSLLLSHCVDYTRDRKLRKGMNLTRAAEAGRVARLSDGKYSLLAMALQNAGVEGWERGKPEIPVTTRHVSVLAPVEKDGLTAYPCARCALCKSDTGTESGGPISFEPEKRGTIRSESVESSGTKGASASSARTRDEEGSSDCAGRRSTELTLVASPAATEFFMEGSRPDSIGESLPEQAGSQGESGSNELLR